MQQSVAHSSSQRYTISIALLSGSVEYFLNVASQKERDIRTAQAEAVLRRNRVQAGNEKCPKWIEALIDEYMGRSNEKTIHIVCADEAGILENVSVSETGELSAREALRLNEEYRREHRRRCVLMRRNEALSKIFIFCTLIIQKLFW